MAQKLVFVNRRRGIDRRFQKDLCRDLPLDLYHRKRRKSIERRDASRSLTEDYYAYMENTNTAQSKADSDTK